MRMWMVDPSLLCRQHLLGEHRELHAIVGGIKKNIPAMKGLAKAKLIEPGKVIQRHEDVVAEMLSRGYQHKTPLDVDFDSTGPGEVDPQVSMRHLRSICPGCLGRMIARDWKQKGKLWAGKK